MAGAPRPLVAGNWKMNGLQRSVAELEKIIAGARALNPVDVLICPPATLIARFAQAAKQAGVAIGAQDCHPEASGAFTGDISAEMLADAGANAVIVGHSERRSLHHETDAEIRNKALAAQRAGLTAIVCVGETQAPGADGQTLPIVEQQLRGSLPDAVTARNLVVAYEPVWAIGSGLTPSTGDVAEAHGFIQRALVTRYGRDAEGVRILYGGSVKPGNASEFARIPHGNRALGGGGPLNAGDRLALVRAYAA